MLRRHRLIREVNPGPARPLLSVDDLASFLGVAPKTIYQWRSRQPVPYGPPAIKVGKYLRWKPEDVASWIEGQAG